MAGDAARMRIRDADPSDRDAIRAITLAAYQQYAEQMPADHWEAYRLNILASLEDVGPAEQIVAEIDGDVIGAVLLYPTDPPEVRLLAVSPSQRGGGIGAALMDECVRRARASGARALGLHTTEMMEAAMRMYQRMGFVREPESDFQPLPDVTIKGYRLKLRDD